jgi:hypothetical protein
MIRDAKFADTHAIVRFLLDCHARSHYAGSAVGVDVEEAKRLVISGIGRHGHQKGGACWVQVVDNDGSIDGLMYATLARIYAIGDKLMATDLFWIVNDHAKPGEAAILMRNMVEWAKKNPLVVEVHIAASAVITDNPAATSRILRKQFGMKEYGIIHRLELGEKKCPVLSAA